MSLQPRVPLLQPQPHAARLGIQRGPTLCAHRVGLRVALQFVELRFRLFPLFDRHSLLVVFDERQPVDGVCVQLQRLGDQRTRQLQRAELQLLAGI